MKTKVTKAVFPIAGLGTRFLPATKSIPKEILTLVDRPLIQYAVDEAREAGIKEFIFVTSRGKSALEDYFDSAPTLEAALRRRKKTDLLAELKRTNMESGRIAYVRQNEARGLGHAVWCARRLIGDEPFAVVLPDDVIAADKPCLKQMVEAHAVTGGSLVATMEVAPHQASSYGVIDIADDMGAIVAAKGIVEKPAPGTQPSNLAVIGRYILDPAVMAHLGRKKVGVGGEIQLTDAIAAEIGERGSGVFGFRFSGRRFDCGSKAGFLQATVSLALKRDDLRDDLAAFIRSEVGDAAPAAEPAQPIQLSLAAGGRKT
jgi:UTP--glucose-1-phosphate uridylyltransferase